MQHEKHRHQISVHENIREFSCKYCGKNFANKQQLTVHEKSIHEKLKDFHCILCEKSFSLVRLAYLPELPIQNRLH